MCFQRRGDLPELVPGLGIVGGAKPPTSCTRPLGKARHENCALVGRELCKNLWKSSHLDRALTLRHAHQGIPSWCRSCHCAISPRDSWTPSPRYPAPSWFRRSLMGCRGYGGWAVGIQAAPPAPDLPWTASASIPDTGAALRDFLYGQLVRPGGYT